MRAIIKPMKKDLVWENCIRFLDFDADYDHMTRYAMYDTVHFNLVMEPSLLISLLTLKEIEEMIRLAKVDLRFTSIDQAEKNLKTFNDIYLFVFENKSKEKDKIDYIMNEKIKKFLLDFEWTEELYEEKVYQTIVMGMVDTYGYIEYEDIDFLYNSEMEKKNKDHIYRNSYEDENLRKVLSAKRYVCYKDLIMHELVYQEIAHISDQDTRYQYPLEFYFNFSYYGLPVLSENKYEELLRKESLVKLSVETQIKHTKTIMQIAEDIIDYVKFNGNLHNYFMPEFIKILHQWPLWRFGGATIDQIEMEENRGISIFPN